ncbi:MAG: immunoglobulin domain-containing protein [Phycisphaerales bacterium]
MKLTKNNRVVRSAAFLAMMCGGVMTARGQSQCPLQWVPSPQQGVPGIATRNTTSDYDSSGTQKLAQWSNGPIGPRLLVLSTYFDNNDVGNTRVFGKSAGWDGNRWTQVPSTECASQPVYYEHNGSLFLGGSFTYPFSPLANKRIARWNGSAWEVVGNGLNTPDILSYGYVSGLGSFGSQLIAGGENLFDTNGVRCRVARWDGSTWHAMPFASQTYGTFERQFVEHHGELFLMIPEDISAVWRWDGAFWQPTPMTNTAIVRTGARLFRHEGQLFASGVFRIQNTIDATLARWNGTAWERVERSQSTFAYTSSPRGIVGFSLHELPGQPFAFEVQMHFFVNGAWVPAGQRLRHAYANSFGASITDVMQFGEDIVVTGYFNRAGDLPVRNIVMWKNNAWHALGAGVCPSANRNNAFFASAAQYEDEAVLAGEFDMPTSNGTGRLLAAWNGASWRQFGVEAVADAWINTVGTDGSRIAITGVRATNNLFEDVIATFDGSQWTRVPQPPIWPPNYIGFHANDVIAIRFGSPFVFAWNGTQWRSLGYSFQGPLPRQFVSLGNNLIVYAQTLQAGSLQKYDGTSWSLLDPALGQLPPDCGIGTYQGNLILHGAFSSVAGVSASNIARWNGTGWEAIGTGRLSPVRAISSYADRLYTLERTGNVSLPSRVSMWNGEAWTTIDETTERFVIAATADGVVVAGRYDIFQPSTPGTPISRYWKYYSTPTPPQLLIDQPTITTCASTSQQLVVHAAGTAPFDFHWFRNGQPVDLSTFRIRSRIDVDERTIRLVIDQPRAADQGVYTCVVSNICSEVTSGPISLTVIGGGVGVCDSIDFNNDCSISPTDIEAYLSVYGEGACIPAEAVCNDIDFNNDGSVFDPIDMDAFFSVYSEGPCF